MSTMYYGIRAPVTQLRLDEHGPHTRILIWVEHKSVGQLVLGNENVRQFMRLFIDEDDPVVHKTNIGDGKTHVSFQRKASDYEQIVSSSGELITVMELRDGMVDRWMDSV